VIFLRQLAINLLEFGIANALGYAKNLVKVLV
jgi:hypothetical protein